MSAYTIASDNTPTLNPEVCAAVKPGSAAAIVLLDAYCGQADAAFGSQHQVFRTTAGTTSATATPEQINRKSAAANATTPIDWSVAPTAVGNPLILLSFSVSTVIVGNRRWLPPSLRNPIIEDAGSANQVTLQCHSGGVVVDRSLTFAEPSAISFRRLTGRRYRARQGRFIVQDEARYFGLSTAPKHGAGATSYQYIQPADWPDSQPTNPTQWVLLLDAGAVPPTFDPATVPWNPLLPERYARSAWSPERTETARAGWVQSLWAVAPTRPPDGVFPERRIRADWNPERSGWAGVSYLPPTWPIPTTLPERVVRPAWTPELSASLGIPYVTPTWPSHVVQPERFMRPVWNPERSHVSWPRLIVVTPDWGYENYGAWNALRPAWNPERSLLLSIPYQPPRLPISVVGMDSFGRPNWNPERSWSAGVNYLPPSWPSPTTLPERYARAQWNPERSGVLGIPYVAPNWPAPTTLPERNARPPWDPERSDVTRAGWTQALWAVAPTRPPDGMFPERLLEPWCPPDQQVFWNPFQFALVSVPAFGYETYGPQMLLRAAWNPPKTETARAGWTQALWAVTPDRPPDGVFPERLLSPWSPERSGHWWVPFQPVPDFGYELYGPHSFLRGVWNPERTALQAIPYLPPTWPTTVVAPDSYARTVWTPERSGTLFPIGPNMVTDPRNVAFTPQLLERFPFPDLNDRNFVLRPVQIITPSGGTTIVYQIFIMDD